MHVLLSTLFLLGIHTHDIQVAYFKIHQDEHHIMVEFIFERDDISSALKEMGWDISDINFKEYVDSNFSLSINNKTQDLVFEEMKDRKDHVILTGKIRRQSESINLIEIENKCLLGIEDHSNIIEVKLNETQRDFLMNKFRTSIEIQY